ncbi:uncharacterized LOC729966 homolog [Elgaria multicarinata webbii]|uniref:uncharacterized LOC729966 homolog n=1 Tax=Elgaria multicarinata webbii TaxID=159646 RepID=UPI002FCD5404
MALRLSDFWLSSGPLEAKQDVREPIPQGFLRAPEGGYRNSISRPGALFAEPGGAGRADKENGPTAEHAAALDARSSTVNTTPATRATISNASPTTVDATTSLASSDALPSPKTISNAPPTTADATTHQSSSDSSPSPNTIQATGHSSGTSHVTAGPATSTSLATSKEPPLTSPAAESTSHNGTATTAGPSDEDAPVTQKPGLVAVICIFLVVLLLGAVVIVVKCCRAREPAFQKLDEVPMGKVAEGAPFARYPPK